MKKLICLLAVLVALMGLTVYELVSGPEADGVELSDSSSSSSSKTTAPASRRARPDDDLPELRRVIQAQPDPE